MKKTTANRPKDLARHSTVAEEFLPGITAFNLCSPACEPQLPLNPRPCAGTSGGPHSRSQQAQPVALPPAFPLAAQQRVSSRFG